jgi:catechol 2,3-dioxygenase-like lactoylglutathione lyase family enzyme
MIKGVHTMFYTSEPEALRAFIRDKLGFPFSDLGDGWLIFDLPEADMGCHPADAPGEAGKSAGTHDISFYCDDIKKTVEELEARGVEFAGGIEDRGYGLVTELAMPGGIKAILYQPLYQKGSNS